MKLYFGFEPRVGVGWIAGDMKAWETVFVRCVCSFWDIVILTVAMGMLSRKQLFLRCSPRKKHEEMLAH